VGNDASLMRFAHVPHLMLSRKFCMYAAARHLVITHSTPEGRQLPTRET
jgi:hypothetical protein